jgi:hypothetical protein
MQARNRALAHTHSRTRTYTHTHTHTHTHTGQRGRQGDRSQRCEGGPGVDG